MSDFKLPEKEPKSIDDTFANLAKPTKTFKDIWLLVFGDISHNADTRQIEYEHDLELFANSLSDSISAIPPDKQRDPDLQIVGTALESSKYCVESPELRDMFTNLISNSMNSDYKEFIHPSFSDIIKNMSPHDAQFLCRFSGKKGLPIADIHYNVTSPSGYDVMYENLFLEYDASCPSQQIQLSISSLCRLGILITHKNRPLLAESMYSALESFIAIKNSFPQGGCSFSLKKGILSKTTLGESFVNVCVK